MLSIVAAESKTDLGRPFGRGHVH